MPVRRKATPPPLAREVCDQGLKIVLLREPALDSRRTSRDRVGTTATSLGTLARLALPALASEVCLAGLDGAA